MSSQMMHSWLHALWPNVSSVEEHSLNRDTPQDASVLIPKEWSPPKVTCVCLI